VYFTLKVKLFLLCFSEMSPLILKQESKLKVVVNDLVRRDQVGELGHYTRAV